MKKQYLLLLVLLFLGCNATPDQHVVINDSHLNYLYREINVDGKDMAVINIYSNYPDYKYVGDDDEGFACVDDAARAAVYYLRSGLINGDPESFRKNKLLVKFLIYMQAENGYFYNFILDDYSINKEFRTSLAEANWWSWRALWTLTESYNYYQENDKIFASEISDAVEKSITAIKKNIPEEYTYENISGIKVPAWLPSKFAADQSAVLLLALTEYYKQTSDKVIYDYIEKLCEGIMTMQVSGNKEYDGAFLSWMNEWHGWGNSQSYALLKSYKILKNEIVLLAALKELDGFYTNMLKTGFINSFAVIKEKEVIKVNNIKKFSQIAYNIRPMVFAFAEAYKITGNKIYAEGAAKTAQWLYGRNIAEAVMYNQETGIIFDGISGPGDVNKNSGAESTIEALLSLQELSLNKISLPAFNNQK